MRIWDIPVPYLCDKHLKAEHYELHCIWSVIVNNKSGYAKHPETMRWRGRLLAMYGRHRQQVDEMTRRGMTHKSDLDFRKSSGSATQDRILLSVECQLILLRQKSREGRCGSPSCLDRLKIYSE